MKYMSLHSVVYKRDEAMFSGSCCSSKVIGRVLRMLVGREGKAVGCGVCGSWRLEGQTLRMSHGVGIGV